MNQQSGSAEKKRKFLILILIFVAQVTQKLTRAAQRLDLAELQMWRRL